MEISVIEQMGFSGYFLIVWDFIRFAREHGIPVGPGRGSAAGSLVAYALRITDIDPLQYDLLFERFLNPERISMPDIDIDFCMRRRGEVIQYVSEKYGRGPRGPDHHLRHAWPRKAVIRDVGRVLGLPYAEVDRIAKLVPDRPEVATLKDGPRESTGPRRARSSAITEVARDPRHRPRARRACPPRLRCTPPGVVIADRSRSRNCVPLCTDQRRRGHHAVRHERSSRSSGLLKMDFLGLRTLTVIDDALKIDPSGRAADLDIDDLPLDDPKSSALFCDGRTSGRLPVRVERHARPAAAGRSRDSFEDLAALNALYRPGPLDAGMVDTFIKRKHGREQVDLHPAR